MKKFFKEFGAFISKGNALDLAVGLVLGTAFNAIIKSLVNDIIMPFISLIGGKDISQWYVLLRGTETYNPLTGTMIYSENAVLLTYGNFIQAIIDFLIIAFAIFLALKVIMHFRTKVDQIKKKLLDEEEVKTQE